jgi:hypothetical protein
MDQKYWGGGIELLNVKAAVTYSSYYNQKHYCDICVQKLVKTIKTALSRQPSDQVEIRSEFFPHENKQLCRYFSPF